MKMNPKAQANSADDSANQFHHNRILKVPARLAIPERRHRHHEDHHTDSQSPPVSPLRTPQLSSSSSSISSWSSSSQASPLSMEDGDSCNLLGGGNNNGGLGGSQGGLSKEDRATYNTKFARYHLETYRQNDRMRWNFDFDHNRPLDDTHHHHQTVASRYQWEPAL